MTGGFLQLSGPPLPSCASTQDLCVEQARAGASEGTVVRALEQTAGRGRNARAWHSPPGLGLWMSFLLRPRVDPARWPYLTAVTALALAEALETLPGTPRDWQAAIKWPNDVYGRRGKLAGILAETAGPAVVIGIGLNIGQTPEDLPDEIRPRAASLRIEGFEPLPAAEAVAAAFDARFGALYRRFAQDARADAEVAADPGTTSTTHTAPAAGAVAGGVAGEDRGGNAGAEAATESGGYAGEDPPSDDWLRAGLRRRFLLRGCRVTVRSASVETTGHAEDVGPLGELLLRTPSGLLSIASGEVVEWRPEASPAGRPERTRQAEYPEDPSRSDRGGV